MSGIYGTLRSYSPKETERKIAQLKHRGNVQVLDILSQNLTAVVDGSFYNQAEDNLLNLYRQYGVDCLHQLNGDFAFVIYDTEKQLLFGAVDRVGSKPLYYSIEKAFTTLLTEPSVPTPTGIFTPIPNSGKPLIALKKRCLFAITLSPMQSKYGCKVSISMHSSSLEVSTPP